MRMNRLQHAVRPVRPAAWALAVVLAVAAGACSPQQQEDTGTEVARNVRVLDLQPESLVEYFEISGPVSPVLGTDLSLEESGPVVALPVEKGQTVRKGDLLVEIDRKILKAEMASAQAQLEVAAFNADKVEQLYRAGKVSEYDYLSARTAQRQARAAADVAARRWERAGLTAPFDGMVTDRYVELGQLVLPGQTAVRLIDPATLELQGHLTATEVGWVRPGDAAQVRLGQGAGTVVGTVSWIGLEADPQTGKFRVEIRIPNEELRLHAGVIGRARLPKQRLDDAVVIPRDAVLPYRNTETAFVVEGDRARRRQLELGPDQGGLVQVLSGLQTGDRLVVRGQRELRDGSLVKITETATAADGSIPGDPGTVRAAVEVGR